MARTALDIVSLAMMKAELRIPAAEIEHNTLLTGQIAAAVSFVSRHLRAPLLDRVEVFRCWRPGDSTAPIVLPTGSVRYVGSVKYWTPGRALREAPDGAIDVDTLGRVVALSGFQIYPPVGGWPLVLGGSLIEIMLTRGMDTPPALRAAVVLCVRQLYDGYREIRPTEAFYGMLRPYRSYTRRRW